MLAQDGRAASGAQKQRQGPGFSASSVRAHGGGFLVFSLGPAALSALVSPFHIG